MKIKKVNELNLSDYTEEELNQYRSDSFTETKSYTLFGELLEKNLHSKPKYTRLFNSDDLESCINWYKEYLDEVKDMDFREAKTINKLTGTRRVIKYHNVILTEDLFRMLDIDMLLKEKKYNV